MRLSFAHLVFLAIACSSVGQAPAPAVTQLPKDARQLLAAAAPFYDFDNASLKPWHLRATYQLYDEKGAPTEQGTYERWWRSPSEYRSTWTRTNVTQSDWHTADGKHFYKATGEALNYFETRLESSLLDPLPEESDLDPEKTRLDRQNVTLSGIKFPCVMVMPQMRQPRAISSVQLGLFPTYCFDPKLPVLRVSYSFGTVTTEFNKVVKVQDRYLAREIVLYEGKRKLLSATVDEVNGLKEFDAALVPPADAEEAGVKTVALSAGVTQGLLLKKQFPVYPQDAKDARISGTVVLEATIGMDGAIHELHVVSAPWPSLAASALWCVSHWQYKPYLFDGRPVNVQTTINVIYTLGGQ